MQDLEDTVTTLKRLLRDRDREVDDLKTAQIGLESELHKVRSQSPVPTASPPRSQSPVNRNISVCIHLELNNHRQTGNVIVLGISRWIKQEINVQF